MTPETEAALSYAQLVSEESLPDTRERNSARRWLVRLGAVAGVIAVWTGSSVGYVVAGVIFIATGAGVVALRRPSRLSIAVIGNPEIARLFDLLGVATFVLIGVFLIVIGLR
jgi:hypothetical protein